MDIEELEKLRKKLRNINLCGALVIFLIMVLCNFLLEPIICVPVMLVVISIGAMVIVAMESTLTTKFNLEYKNKFVLGALKSTFDEYEYLPEEGISSEVIKSAQFIGKHYESKDYITVVYNKIQAYYSYIYTYERGYEDRVDILFKGRYFIFYSNNFSNKNIQVFSKIYYSHNTGKAVELEFYERFHVHCDENTDTSDIITLGLMNLLIGLDEKYRGRVSCCFVGNKIHLRISEHKNPFEPCIYRKIDEEKTNIKFLEEIEIMKNFIDEVSK